MDHVILPNHIKLQWNKTRPLFLFIGGGGGGGQISNCMDDYVPHAFKDKKSGAQPQMIKVILHPEMGMLESCHVAIGWTKLHD